MVAEKCGFTRPWLDLTKKDILRYRSGALNHHEQHAKYVSSKKFSVRLTGRMFYAWSPDYESAARAAYLKAQLPILSTNLMVQNYIGTFAGQEIDLNGRPKRRIFGDLKKSTFKVSNWV